MASLLVGGCKEKPAPTWVPGEAQLSGTVRSKEIIFGNPNDPNDITCYKIVLELQGKTSEQCVGKEEWVRAAPGSLMIWD